jgi:hypothetical protein
MTATASVLAGKAMIAAGLRRPPEGWRRTVGILLRSESTRFALSVFGLRVPGSGSAVPPGRAPLQYRTAQALQAFLATEPDAHFVLEWLQPVTNRRRIPAVELVVLQFGPDGRLEAINLPGGLWFIRSRNWTCAWASAPSPGPTGRRRC